MYDMEASYTRKGLKLGFCTQCDIAKDPAIRIPLQLIDPNLWFVEDCQAVFTVRSCLPKDRLCKAAAFLHQILGMMET